MNKSTLNKISKALGAVLFCVAIGFPTASGATTKRPSVSGLVKQVEATYRGMHSYSSEDGVTTIASMPATGHIEIHFTVSMKLARPNLYRINWETHAPNMTLGGAAWSAGDGNFILAPGKSKPLRIKDLQMALGITLGASGGSSGPIPVVFFGLGGKFFHYLSNGAFGNDQDVDGDPCYVVTATIRMIKERVSISKKTKLIREIRSSFSRPVKLPRATDEQVKKIIEAMGKRPTPDLIAQVKKEMQAGQAIGGLVEKGSVVHVIRKIVLNAALHKADFIPPAASDSK